MPVFAQSSVAGFQLRPATASDLPFVTALFASTREAERPYFTGDQSLWDMLMENQALAQDRHYRAHYPGATIDILQLGEEAVGRLCLCALPQEIRVMDIALVPRLRNQGRGSALLKEIMAEGVRRQLPVRLHVENFNPAFRLYKRLGFVHLEDKGLYQFLEWRPAVAA